MPTEFRKLLFSEDEVRTAAVRHCLRLSIHMPKGNVETVEIGRHDHDAVSLLFRTDDPGARDRVELSRDQIGAALIRYCREQEIPLPRESRKLLRREERGYALFIARH